jgi:hypothetical protein
VRYGTTGYPVGPGDGTAVENGAGGEFPNPPASADSFVHTGLTNGQLYYYSAFAADEVPNYSTAAQVTQTPEDIYPPLAVSAFSATPQTDGSVELDWATPDDSDFVGALIRYSASTYPSTPTSGTAVENGASGMFPGNPATLYDFTHTGLQNGVLHYYSIFTYDEVPNYSAAVTDTARPNDQIPPEISVSVFQNPYITNHLDVYLAGSELLLFTTVHCEVADDTLDMELVDEPASIFRGDYDLCCTGVVSIYASAQDLSGLLGETTRNFSSAFLLASSGGIATSVDGLCRVSVRGNVIAKDTYVLIFDTVVDESTSEKAYEILPPGLELKDFVEIAISYPEHTQEPEHLSIARLGDKGMTPVESYIDTETNRVIAYVDRFGTYGLLTRPDVVTPTYGAGDFMVLQNVPNPFAGSTVIAFEAPRAGHVRADVISIDGRFVQSLYDGYVIPGRHRIEWNGDDTGGRKVASGVYFYRVTYGSKTITKKMIHLR